MVYAYMHAYELIQCIICMHISSFSASLAITSCNLGLFPLQISSLDQGKEIGSLEAKERERETLKGTSTWRSMGQ